MGIEGAVGFLKRKCSALGSNSVLRSDSQKHVVIDATKALDKLVLDHIKTRERRFQQLGYSMVLLGAFFRDMIESLLNNNIQPLFVFNGGRKSEEQFGPRVSCADHLRYSCGAALHHIERTDPGRNFDLPCLATNVLKEVICDMGLTENIYQATYEVYPTLAYLAHKFMCPVLTGHSDFVFHAAPAGFYWFDDLILGQNAREPMRGILYEHSRLLESHGLNQEHSSTLRTFSTLLRPDFHRHYYEPLNSLFRLTGDLRMTANVRDRKLTRRLIDIVDSVRHNPNLRSYDTILSHLSLIPNAPLSLMRDFKNTHETYAHHFSDFATTEFAQLLDRGPQRPSSPRAPRAEAGPNMQASRVQPADLERALTRAHSTAEFLFNLANTTFFRTRVEDTLVARSTFSLQDAARQYLLDNAMPPMYEKLRLYDRRLASMQLRHLKRRSGETERLSGERLLKLYHTSTRELDTVTSELTSMDIEAENGRELALHLLLARCAFRLAFRRDYNNDPPTSRQERPSSPQSNNTASLGSQSSGVSSMRRLRDYQELRGDFYAALLNSFVYHARERQHNQPSESVPADIRVARERLRKDIVDTRDPSILPENNFHQYIKLKHMIEAMNSILHSYYEMNSLYGYPAPKIYASRAYDGVLIYKIMCRLSNKLRGYLLNLTPELSRILDLSEVPRDAQA